MVTVLQSQWNLPSIHWIQKATSNPMILLFRTTLCPSSPSEGPDAIWSRSQAKDRLQPATEGEHKPCMNLPLIRPLYAQLATESIIMLVAMPALASEHAQAPHSMSAFDYTSIEDHLWQASLLWHSGDGFQATALWQCPMVWCWCYGNSICTMALPTIVLAPLASGVNDDGCLEPWQARGSMLNDT